MGKQFEALTPRLTKFIEAQKIFFVGTAAEEGTVNLSPKGMDSLRIKNANEIIWLNLTGSGNETAAHLLRNNRMTIMFCFFDKQPLILRLYGKAIIYHESDPNFDVFISEFPPYAGARQIINLQIEMVQTSCGFGVPYMEYLGERDTLELWAEEKGKAGIKEYWKKKNTESIDGFDTGIAIS